MKRSIPWAWLALGLGVATLVATYLRSYFTTFCWSWVFCSLCIGWIVLTRLPNGVRQSLLLGAAMLNGAAGVCNGLVMATNGSLMPYEQYRVGSDTPAFFDSQEDRHGSLCRLVLATDKEMSPTSDSAMHFAAPVPVVERGRRIPTDTQPRLAFLDDRFHAKLCGQLHVYSAGDLMFFIGTVMIGPPGLALTALVFLWKLLCKKPA